MLTGTREEDAPRNPSSCHIFFNPEYTPLYSAEAPWTCKMILSRSSGETTVLDAAPARAPAESEKESAGEDGRKTPERGRGLVAEQMTDRTHQRMRLQVVAGWPSRERWESTRGHRLADWGSAATAVQRAGCRVRGHRCCCCRRVLADRIALIVRASSLVHRLAR